MTITGWWKMRMKREKIMLASAVLVLVCSILYLCVEPMIEEKARLNSILPQMQNDLVWMQTNLAFFQQFRESEKNTDVKKISAATLEEMVRESGLQESLSDLKPDDDNGVKVLFEEVSYVKLLDLLYRSRALKNAIVSQATIIAVSEKPGTVKADLILKSDNN